MCWIRLQGSHRQAPTFLVRTHTSTSAHSRVGGNPPSTSLPSPGGGGSTCQKRIHARLRRAMARRGGVNDRHKITPFRLAALADLPPPGGGEENLPCARLTSTSFQTAKAPRSVFFVPAPDAPVVHCRSPSEGARDAGVKSDPRTLAPRGAEAVRKTKPQVRQTFGVPRAVF